MWISNEFGFLFLSALTLNLCDAFETIEECSDSRAVEKGICSDPEYRSLPGTVTSDYVNLNELLF
ncbi:hypothetical protein TcasGA2_TC032350 [Tribolium castaneum]|uniref:Uncharacterized protein n=1 Tax=Tribolium castaneum TaxID=7070 RepID=A0A139WLY0_TRICA|nr:hypothetical protein TcasGA2_TC032350 [Tribolium castaneum]